MRYVPTTILNLPRAMLPRLSYSFCCMKRVDRRNWAEGTTIVSHGTRVGIRTDTPGLLERIQTLFPPGWREADRPEVRRLYSLTSGGKAMRPRTLRSHVLYMNAFQLFRSMDLDDVLPRLEADMQLYVAERARRRIFVHAGVVAWNGKAILLPGHTQYGKTTLVSELLRAGATYYSDEYAVLDERGRVHPYPRLLSVRSCPTDERPIRRSAEAFGAEVGDGPLPVALVAMTQYRPGVRWRPRRLSEGRAILALMENTVPARRRPKAVVATLQEVVSTATVLRGPRGEAGQTAGLMLERLACA